MVNPEGLGNANEVNLGNLDLYRGFVNYLSLSRLKNKVIK